MALCLIISIANNLIKCHQLAKTQAKLSFTHLLLGDKG